MNLMLVQCGLHCCGRDEPVVQVCQMWQMGNGARPVIRSIGQRIILQSEHAKVLKAVQV